MFTNAGRVWSRKWFLVTTFFRSACRWGNKLYFSLSESIVFYMKESFHFFINKFIFTRFTSPKNTGRSQVTNNVTDTIVKDNSWKCFSLRADWIFCHLCNREADILTTWLEFGALTLLNNFIQSTYLKKFIHPNVILLEIIQNFSIQFELCRKLW